MSYFKNFSKTICSTRFTKPNNLIISGMCNPAVLLCNSPEPCVDHLNSVKALYTTIQKLNEHVQGRFSSIIEKQLNYLHSATRVYVDSCTAYVEDGGYITAQGAANLYACAEELGLSANWLSKNVQPLIPTLVKNMSIENLEDVLSGLNKYHPGCKFIDLVSKQLSSRNQEPFEYVERSVNEVAEFQESIPSSNNILLNVIHRNQTAVHFYARKWIYMLHDGYNSYTRRPSGYVLHN